MAEPESRFYISQGLRLHYTDWGNREKPLLVMIHGGMDHARSWDSTARALQNDFHVVVPDLRGHGDSAWAPGSMYSVLDSVLDTVNLLDSLDVADVSVMGHSYGAIVGFLFAGIYPERVKKLVLIEGTTPSRFGRKEPIWKRVPRWVNTVNQVEQRKKRYFDSIEDAENKIRRLIPTLSHDQIQHLAFHGVTENNDGTYRWKYDEMSKILSPIHFDEEEMAELRQRITCPVLFLYGERGWSGNPFKDENNSTVDKIKAVKIHDAGHWLHHECFDEYIEAVRSFFEG